MVFRELNEWDTNHLSLLFDNGQQVRFEKIIGEGHDFNFTVTNENQVEFLLDDPNSFCLYQYKIDQ